MRVICIQENWSPSPHVNGEKPIVVFGGVYNVYDECYSMEGEPCYELVEHLGFCYARGHFAILSNICEKEFERNYDEVAVTNGYKNKVTIIKEGVVGK